MEFLRRLNHKGSVQGIDLGLRRVASLAHSLGLFSPHGHLPSFIHIAGTNGKGSVCAKAEHAVHHSFGEWEMITYDELSSLAHDLESKVEALQLHEEDEEMVEPTYFEALTLISFMLFKSRQVDVAIVEAGLGGLTDATNILPNPKVCCITSIGLEHQRFLGDDIESIAKQKAGIIKPGAKVVVGPNAQPYAVFQEAAEVNGCSIVQVQRRTDGDESVNEENSLIAEAVLAAMDDSWRVSLNTVKAPCRFEQHAVAGTQVILDAAHNPSAFRRLAKDLRSSLPEDIRITFVLAFSSDKSAFECVRALIGADLPIHAIVFTHSRNEGRSSDADALLNQCIQLSETIQFSISTDVKNTMGALVAESEGAVVAAGTVFILDDIKKALGLSLEEEDESDGFDANEQKL